MKRNQYNVNYHIAQYQSIIAELRQEILRLKTKMVDSDLKSQQGKLILSMCRFHAVYFNVCYLVRFVATSRKFWVHGCEPEEGFYVYDNFEEGTVICRKCGLRKVTF